MSTQDRFRQLAELEPAELQRQLKAMPHSERMALLPAIDLDEINARVEELTAPLPDSASASTLMAWAAEAASFMKERIIQAHHVMIVAKALETVHAQEAEARGQ